MYSVSMYIYHCWVHLKIKRNSSQNETKSTKSEKKGLTLLNYELSRLTN